MVVKADGLAAGKGVTVCDDERSALQAVDDAMERGIFGAAGKRVVIEDKLAGQEISFFALCDGRNAMALGMAQDHKPVFDGDRGPNTGGMGAYSPVPQFDAALEDRIMREVVEPTLAVMAERGMPFRGVLFVGLMVDGDRLGVLEFNVRFGDPECEALMMRLEGDLAEALLAAARGEMAADHFRLSPRSAVSVVLASGGYPGSYEKGLADHAGWIGSTAASPATPRSDGRSSRSGSRCSTPGPRCATGVWSATAAGYWLQPRWPLHLKKRRWRLTRRPT